MASQLTTKNNQKFIPLGVFERIGNTLRRCRILVRFYNRMIEVEHGKKSLFFQLPSHPANWIIGDVLNMRIEGSMLLPIEETELYANPEISPRYKRRVANELEQLENEIKMYKNFQHLLEKAQSDDDFQSIMDLFFRDGMNKTPTIEEIEKQIFFISSGNSNWIKREVLAGPTKPKVLVIVAIDTGASIGLITPEKAKECNAQPTGKSATVRGYLNGLKKIETVFLYLEYKGVTVKCLMGLDSDTEKIATVPIMVPVSVYHDLYKENIDFI